MMRKVTLLGRFLEPLKLSKLPQVVDALLADKFETLVVEPKLQ